MSEKADCAMKQERTQLVWLSAHPKHTLIRVREGLRAGEVVGEGRVELCWRYVWLQLLKSGFLSGTRNPEFA